MSLIFAIAYILVIIARMNKICLLIATAVIFTAGCKVNKNSDTQNSQPSLLAKQINIVAFKSPAEYQASRTKSIDLLHTSLKIRFNYEKQHAYGQINLLCKPYFYATNTAVFDAKGLELHRVAVIKNKDTVNVKYTYDSLQLHITLDKTYTNSETFQVFIDYTAKPNEIKAEGSAAIRDAKGLYFINPLKADVNKPRQIWTQGETESNSCWMPTIDAPNEKHTQELWITAQANEVTLSNGKLISVTQNTDGTHTDYWKQTLPHAPYLTMMAIGEFAITKHKWHDSVEVSYYLEKDYHPYADLIFGPTKEMLTCFSQKLGVDYPWEKFSQIIVRDFVSGAMENTSAVLHGEFVQHDAREHLDNDQEDIIAHEMFHHWFGDLTTAESWSNLPLNESFATYGEYIWNEWKHGNIEADAVFESNLNGYLRSKQNAAKTPIRFYYHNKEDMFDGVSYSKGGRILHMLRKEVGDEAFFKSLQLYLTKNRFKSAEIHDLRLAFEETTGLDLNWFFNQWFLKAGHPELEVKTTYHSNLAQMQVIQKQDSSVGLYRLPLVVEVYDKRGVKQVPVLVSKATQTFTFEGDSVYLINFDANKALVAKLDWKQSESNWYTQLTKVNTWKAKEQAMTGLFETYKENGNELTPYLKNAIEYCLNHTHHQIVQLGIRTISLLNAKHQPEFEKLMPPLLHFKNKASIRASALLYFYTLNNKKYIPYFTEAQFDSSNQVVANAMYGLNYTDSLLALEVANKWRNYKNYSIAMAVSSVISKNSLQDENTFFSNAINNTSFGKRNIMYAYSKYLIRSKIDYVANAVPVFEQINKKLEGEERKYLLFNTVNEVKEYLEGKNSAIKKALQQNNSNAELTAESKKIEQVIDQLEALVKEH
ncbi:MAG: M1 family aminopeptidase [Bacteroidota bacterium]